MSVDVVLCAHNEASTISGVLAAASGARSTSAVIVVADACSDATRDIAEEAGALVIEISAGDKGTAMTAGLAAVGSDAVLFLDADLGGLTPAHVDALATAPPLAGMVVGLRDGANASGLPPISGERRLPTDFARTIPMAGQGYRVELVIDAAVARAGLPHRHYAMKGLSNPIRPWRHPLMWADLALYGVVNAPAMVLYTEQSIRAS